MHLIRTAAGHVCCAGKYLCPACAPRAGPATMVSARALKEYLAHKTVDVRALRDNQEDTMTNDTPNSYAAGIAELKAAAATPFSIFEDAWKKARMHELDDEHAADLSTPLRMTAAQVEDFVPPDSYAAGIKALQSKGVR